MVAVLLLLTGILLLLIALAVLGGRQEVAASRPLRQRSKTYGVAVAALGAALVVAAGIAALLR